MDEGSQALSLSLPALSRSALKSLGPGDNSDKGLRRRWVETCILISAEGVLALSATTTAIAYLIRQEIYAPYLRGPCRDGLAKSKPTHAPTPPIWSGSSRLPQLTTFA